MLLLPASIVSTAAHGERTYKWVDADGNVTYSNRMPPESIKRERQELNNQGRVVRVYSAPLTAEEKAEARRMAELAAEKKERARKRA
ncbi:MAG TPA: DUF4124 domain-containing protein, partial [Gammaproteobacteria bacterium]|nr:DUF4124 domain-containing protein [Gammaproteobacteria bacterium]